MYEFHGWMVLRYHTHDTDQDLQEEAYLKFIGYLDKMDVEKISNIQRRNGQDTWTISGLHNHFSNYVQDIFNWVSVNLPGSYGLLYVYDDEDARNGNEFVVWKLARGTITQEKDNYLSPFIPVVEDEFDPTRND